MENEQIQIFFHKMETNIKINIDATNYTPVQLMYKTIDGFLQFVLCNVTYNDDHDM